jgi:Alpha/beta hydrolase
VSAPATVQQLAGWDVPALHRGVRRLGGPADRLLPWRTRLDALGRRLGTAECWSGPAGTAAGAALVELSTAVSGVSGALDDSLAHLRGLATAAAEAQEWAVAALSDGVSLDDAGLPVGLPPPPVPAMAADQVADVLAARQAGQLAAVRAEEALAAAGRALHQAREAQHPLARLGLGPVSPVAFTDLLVRLPADRVPPLPPADDPQAVAGWWAALTAAGQLAAIRARPAAVGALDGLPAWARDRANRLRLAAVLRDLPEGSGQRTMAETVAAQLAVQATAGQTAQLLQFDPAGDLAAVALGDLDTAAALGVLVPGINTTPADDLPALMRDAAAVRAAAVEAAPGVAVAVVAWLGYRTPGLATMGLPQAARRGGPALDRALDGLAAAREVPGGGPAPRTSVIAHSYGTVVAGRAVRAPGRLAADALVLLGSPGVPGGGAADLEAGEVYGAWSMADPVSWLQWFGDTPSDWSFRDRSLPTEPTEGHTDYYDADRPTLAAIGQVVAGTGEVG